MCLYDSSSWRCLGLAITHQTPPSSAARTLCSRCPQLGLLSFAVSLTFNRSSLLPGYSSSLASSHHSLLKTQLLHVDTPLLPPPPNHLNRIPFPLFTSLLVSQEFTVFVSLKICLCLLCEFCTSLYTQVYCSVVSDSLQPHGLAAHQAPLSMGILQARILEWVAVPFSRGSSQPMG